MALAELDVLAQALAGFGFPALQASFLVCILCGLLESHLAALAAQLLQENSISRS